MPNRQLSNPEIVRRLEPWFPVFRLVTDQTLRDVLEGMLVMGTPKKTERASDVHRCYRNNFRQVRDFAESMVTLVEEPDGQGLDYLIFNGDQPLGVRWGRFDGETVRRNRTGRTQQIQEQGVFEFAEEADVSTMQMVTMAHTIEDEYTEGGHSCMWIGKLILLRERMQVSEVITEVHMFNKPEQSDTTDHETPPAVVEARETEADQLQRMIRRIRRSA